MTSRAVVSSTAQPVLIQSLIVIHGKPSVPKIQNRGVPVASEMVGHWSQIGDWDCCPPEKEKEKENKENEKKKLLMISLLISTFGTRRNIYNSYNLPDN